MKKLILLFSVLFTLLPHLQAQEKWVTYTNKNNVQAIAVEGENIWMATTGGVLVRNTSTGTIVAEYTKENGLTHNNVALLSIDKQGNKWISSYGAGVSKFDGSTWTTYNRSNSGLASDTIYSIVTDAAGNLWFGTYDKGVSKFNGSTWTTYNTSNSGLAGNYVYSITTDAAGNLWFGTNDGVSKFDGTTWTTYNTSNSGLASNGVLSIASDSVGNVWFGTYGYGISKFDGTNWTTYKKSIAGLASNYVYSITTDAAGNLWVGTDKSGVSKFNGTSWTTYNTYKSEIVSNDVRSIAIDANGNVFFGTNTGVSKYKDNTWTTYNIYNSGLVNLVNSIATDAAGNLWFGTEQSGVSKFNGTSWTNYNTYNSRLVTNFVYSITTDAAGNVWVGTSWGLSKFDGSTWTTYDKSNSGLVGDNVISITTDADGNLWFGTTNGVSKFDGTTWTTYNTSNSGLSSNRVLSIASDSVGNVWFGGNGVSKFDGTSWTTYNTSNSGIANNYVESISTDATGNLWVGTYDKGVSKFDGTNWTTYNTSNSGLANNYVESISTDAAGNLWVGTYDKGVSKFDGTTWTTYNTSNSGLAGNYVYSITTDAAGNLWFGTNDGVSVLKNAFEVPKNTKQVSGKIYLDKNQNKVKDVEEKYLANQKVNILPGNRVAISNSGGEYSFLGDSGVSYTVSYLPKNYFTATKDTTFSFKLTQNLQLADFGIYAKDTTIITSNISLGNGRCNSEVTNYYTYTNTGSTSPNTKVVLTLDKDVKIKSSFPAYDSLVANKLYYTFNNFEAGSQRQIKLNFINPDFTRMADTLVYESSLAANGRTFSSATQRIVTCSYDPNDKAVSPLPIGDKNYTLKKELLTYTIRFQNTGNDTAFYVAVKDTLDKALDYNTFEVVGSSHKVNTTLDENNGLVIFAFNNIVLPDSTRNEKESNGFVSYTIQAKSNIAENTLVKNTAYIYFDQNPAIITNTTLNNMVTTIPIVLSLESISAESINQVVPQPIINQSELRFENKSGNANLQVLDLSGKVVFQKQTQGNVFELNKNEFPHNGIYIYQLQTTTTHQTGKLVVE